MQVGHPDEAVASGLYEDGSTIVDGKAVSRILARCAVCPKVVVKGAPPNLPLQTMDRWIGQQGWRITSGEPRKYRYTCPECLRRHRRVTPVKPLAVMEQELLAAAQRKKAHMETAAVAPVRAPVSTFLASNSAVTKVEIRAGVSGKIKGKLWLQVRLAKKFIETFPPERRRVQFYETTDHRLVLLFDEQRGGMLSAMHGSFYLVRPAAGQKVVLRSRVSCAILPASWDGKMLITDHPMPFELWPIAMPSYPSKEPAMELKPAAHVTSATFLEPRAKSEPLSVPADKMDAVVADLKTAITMINDIMMKADDTITLRVEGNRIKGTRRVVRVFEEPMS